MSFVKTCLREVVRFPVALSYLKKKKKPLLVFLLITLNTSNHKAYGHSIPQLPTIIQLGFCKVFFHGS